MSFRSAVQKLIWQVFGSPNRDRLNADIAQEKVCLTAKQTSLAPQWHDAAAAYIKLAEDRVRCCELQEGWAALFAARRAILRGTKSADALRLEAVALWHEAETDKIGGWRAKAIFKLLGTGKEKDTDKDVLKAAVTADEVADAMALRDDRTHTTYLRLALRRRHLTALALIGLATFAALLYLDFRTMGLAFPPGANAMLPEPVVLAAAALLGVLGACLSAAQGIMQTDISARIPHQLMDAFVIWMRPVIGATAAVVLIILLRSRLFTFPGSTTLTVQIAAAIFAGYSERFIVGAIGQAADGIAKKS